MQSYMKIYLNLYLVTIFNKVDRYTILINRDNTSCTGIKKSYLSLYIQGKQYQFVMPETYKMVLYVSGYAYDILCKRLYLQ